MADVIISDYSTVIYEAGLLGIPVYLYAYDWDTYREKRGLTIDFENDVPALFTGDPEAIMKAIEDKDFDTKARRARRRPAKPSSVPQRPARRIPKSVSPTRDSHRMQ